MLLANDREHMIPTHLLTTGKSDMKIRPYHFNIIVVNVLIIYR